MPTNPIGSARSTVRAAAVIAVAPARLVRRRIAALLDAQDAAARARGWTVEVRPVGGRVYRDPRFGRLAATAVAATNGGSGRPVAPASSGALR